MPIKTTAESTGAARRRARRLPRLTMELLAGAAGSCLAVAVCLAAAVSPAAAQLPYAEIEQIDIVQSVEAWELRIPFAGAWTHSSMEHPPRIVIDLHDARSRLPRAPGLYSLRLSRGPVEVLRTSQFRNRPGNRKVRVTLVLSDALPYMAEQFAGEVWVRIPRPANAAWGPDWEETLRRGGRVWEVLPAPDQQETFSEQGGGNAADPGAGPDAANRESGRVGGAAGAGGATQTSSVPVGDEPSVGEAAVADGEDRGCDSLAQVEWAIDQLLADTTLFRPGRPRVRRAWDDAAARLLEEAQGAFLAGDTAAAREDLATCVRFYADTDPGQQALRLQGFFLRVIGDELVAPADSSTAAGPWPLLRGAVLAALFAGAYDQGDLQLAAAILGCWRDANRTGDRWAEAALHLAEARLVEGEADRALTWVSAALAARPDWRGVPRVALLRAGVWGALGRVNAADTLLQILAEDVEPAVRCRALAARADLQYRHGAPATARQLYQSLLGDGVPAVEREWAHYQVGNCWAAEGAWSEARAWLEQVAGDAGNFWSDNARLRLATLAEVRDAAAWH
ncbi:MAG: hypothetical protein KAY32_00795 [Candidatus Eisenbacteria sp.]|nr:hypothetical protein [Candidatus Eisenbacteria bacterium]